MKIVRSFFEGVSWLILTIIITIVVGGYLFIKINEHLEIKFYEIMPKEDWTKTAPGRYAHSLKYEDKLPKPVPYDISSP